MVLAWKVGTVGTAGAAGTPVTASGFGGRLWAAPGYKGAVEGGGGAGLAWQSGSLAT